MKTFHIHISGQVQGVGFRPFVYHKAKAFAIRGEVFNAVDGVHVYFNATEADAKIFYRELLLNPPIISKVIASTITISPSKIFHEFKIVTSNDKGYSQVLLTPDFALCAECRIELLDDQRNNRRKDYPFITCTQCGPRYSIIKRLPYDRENTSMSAFEMCPVCKKEYNDPTDRRYFSQTNSCPECGIRMTLSSVSGEIIEKDYQTIISKTICLLKNGKIVAVKGIGGYLLVADATNKDAINRLREIKKRPKKPFALMYPNMDMLKNDVFLNPDEENEIKSSAAPILILRLKDKNLSQVCFSAIAPGLNHAGVMLPYAPVFELLLSQFATPVIATSANVSNSPIVYDEVANGEELNMVADYILSNNRQVVLPQDDSVVKYSPFYAQKIVTRRSRGLAPTYFYPGMNTVPENVLATGALLKSTFTFTHQQNIYVSQYLGNLDDYDVQVNYRSCVDHFLNVLNAKPGVILTDKHPGYFSTAFGEKLAADLNIPVKQTQHHEAHFAAVLGENNLLENGSPILGIIWDGFGLGNDEQVWGGEFFSYENYEIKRLAHFSYFDYLLGDKMAREPRLSALSATKGLKGSTELLQNNFTETEWTNYQKLLLKTNNLQTSSMGRIFDAVASLLDVCHISSYEGEAAMSLENIALHYFTKHGLNIKESYFDDNSLPEISTAKLFTQLIDDLMNKKDKMFIAAKFHYSLASLVNKIAIKFNIQYIALSGGVFQNGLLIDLIKKELNSSQQLFLHKQLSPNDECISYGQLCCYSIDTLKIKHNKTNMLSHSV